MYGCSAPWTRSRMASSAANWSRAPASLVQKARLPRVVRVSGCSAPWARSRTGSSAAYRSRAPELGLLLETVHRADDVKGFQVLPRRWVVERTFGCPVRNRRLARDYERLTACSESMIKIAMIRLMAARLAGYKIIWANAAERDALRRMTIEDHLLT